MSQPAPSKLRNAGIDSRGSLIGLCDQSARVLLGRSSTAQRLKFFKAMGDHHKLPWKPVAPHGCQT